MLNRLLVAAVALGAGAACAPVLKLSRPTAPEANLGTVRTLSVSVDTDVARAAELAVTKGLVFGELPVPVPVDEVVRQKLANRLQALGYAVCPAAPCGDGAMTVVMEESSAGTQVGTNGVVQAVVRLRARIKVKQNDGTEPYDYSFWANRSGGVAFGGQLVDEAAENIASRFQTTLLPGREKSKLPLEDGGPLSPGVNMLLSNNWDGAIGYFTDLTQKQPQLAGAWYDLGVAWEAKGDWGQAFAAYEQAAARDRKQRYIDAVNAARQRAPPPEVPQPIPVQ